jgi:hypothetical protein
MIELQKALAKHDLPRALMSFGTTAATNPPKCRIAEKSTASTSRCPSTLKRSFALSTEISSIEVPTNASLSMSIAFFGMQIDPSEQR